VKQITDWGLLGASNPFRLSKMKARRVDVPLTLVAPASKVIGSA